MNPIFKATQNPLQEAFFTVHDLLQAFIQNQGFQVETLAIAFGSNINLEMVQSLEQQFSQGDFTALPEIEVRSADELSGAFGVYLQEQDRIFLSQAFLATASQSQIVAVILEEIGHAIDARINTTDSAGDEGAIFSALVGGVELSAVELQNLKTEDDSILIEIDGQTLIAEAASTVTVNSSQALSLDGVDGSLSIPDSDAIDFSASQDFTVEAWIKADPTQVDLGNGDNDIIEKWGVGGGGYPFVIRYYRDQGKIIVARYDGANNPAIVSTAIINDEQFHHVAFVKDGATLKLYIDGQLDGSTTDTTTGNTQNSSPLFVGSRSTANHFKGEIDELRLWNVARTESEIQANLDQQLSGSEAGLIGYYTFDDGTATDLVNGNDGTFTGGATTVESLIGRSITATATEDDADFSVDLLADVSQPSSSVANLTLVSGDAAGVTVNGSSLDVDPSAYSSLADGESEVIEYSYDITDGNGDEIPQVATLTINGRNDAPILPKTPALAFDGVNDYVNIANHSSPSTQITVEAWAKSDPSNWNSYGSLVSQRSGFVLHPMQGGKGMRFVVHHTGGKSSIEFWPGASFDITEWHHYAGTYDGNTMYLYIDGVIVQSGSFPGLQLVADNGSLTIGRDDGFNRYFDGQIDDVRIWDVSRSATQIQDNYQKPLNGDEAGLVGYYSFDDGTATDLGSTNNSGTLVGGVTTATGPLDQSLMASLNQGDPNLTVDLLNGASDPDGDSLSIANLTLVSGNDGGATLNGNTLEINSSYYNFLVAGQTEVVEYSYDITDGKGGTVSQTVTVTIDGTNHAPVVNGSQVLSLDGTNDYVEITINEPETEITHEFWFKTTNADTGIFSITDGGLGENGSDRHIYLANGEIQARVWSNETIGSSGLNLADGQWHHVAHTVGASIGGQHLYIDGQLVASGTKTASNFNGQTTALIGHSVDSANPYFDGQIDEVRVWNVARTQGEIQTDLHSSLTGNEANLLAYYNFDDGTAKDLTNNYDGNLVNGATTANHQWIETTADVGLVDLLSGASDADGDSLTVANLTLLSGDDGGVTLNGNELEIDASYYAPLGVGQTEILEYSYDITDGNGGTVSQTAAVTIKGVNDAPFVPGSQAISFDGTDDFIILGYGYDADLKFEGTATYTLEAWIKPQAKGSVISNRYNNSSAFGGYSLDVESDGRIRTHREYSEYDSASYEDIETSFELYSSSTINFNQWNHITTTYDGETLSLYINGEFAGSTLAGAINNGSQYTLIGSRYNLGYSVANSFLGEIDSVRIWDVARNQEQIQQDLNRHLTGSETGLVAYYTFDDGTATDLSDSGYDGGFARGAAPVEASIPDVLTVSVSQGDSDPTVDLLSGASDPDLGDSLNVSNLTAFHGDAGGITLNENNNTLEIDSDYYLSLGVGESEFVHYVYDITDGNGGTVTRNAVVQIDGVNEAPIAPQLNILVPGDAVFDFDLIDYDPTSATDGIQDPDGDTLVASNVVKVSGDDTGVTLDGATVTIDPSAYAALKPGESEVIEYSYDVSDGSATVSTGISFAIQGVNDAPVVSSAVTASVHEHGDLLTVDLLAGAIDPEDDSMNVANVTLQSGDDSGITINGNTLEIDPSPYDLATGQFTDITYSYDITDGNGGTVSQTATLTIHGATDSAAEIGQAGTVSLAQIADEQNPVGFVINASQPNAAFGFSASTAGDVNNDGFVDLIIGAPRSSSTTIPVGADLATVPSASVSGDLKFLAPGVNQNNNELFAVTHVNGQYQTTKTLDQNGWSISSLSYGVLSLERGTVTAGFEQGNLFTYTPYSGLNLADGEVLEETITLRLADDGNAQSGPFTTVDITVAIVGGGEKGGAYVVYGKPDGSAIDLQSVGNQGFVLSGGTPGANAGFSVSGGYDLNGDDLPDFLVGEPFGGSSQAYGVFNSGQGNNVSLQAIAQASNSEGFALSQANSATGYSVSLADVNGNGLADMIISSPLANGGNGKVSVVFDHTDGSPVNLTTLGQGNNQGFEITYPNNFGRTTSSAGDFNGDGYEDVIVGQLANRFVVFGKEDTLNVQAGSDFTITSGAGIVFAGTSTWNSFFSGGGDVNGDGLSDVVVSEQIAVPDRISVVFGQANSSSVSLDTIASEGGGGFSLTYDGASPASYLPNSPTQDVTGVGETNYKLHKAHILGDIDGDGLDDLAINFSNSNDVGSKVYVIFGKSDFATIDLTQPLSSDQGFIIQGNIDAGDADNASLYDQDFFESLPAGDVNGDGLADILITAPFDNFDDAANDNAGKSYVLFGGDYTGTISQQGSNGDDTFTGTISVDSFIGGLGNDSLLGAGGQDILYGGAGNDVLGVADTTFQRIDGGLGEDTLQLTGSGITLDFETARGFIREIERIDLTGSGDNTLSLASRDVANLSQTSNRLIVTGDAGDTLNSLNQDWVLAPGGSAVSLPEFAGDTFQQYVKGDLELFIDTDISASIGVPVLDTAFNLDENSTNGTDVGNVGNGTSGNSYTFLSGNESGAFAIDNNGQITVADSTQVDFEAGDRLTLTVQVTDAANLTDTGIITVLLNDLNDTPVFAPVNPFDPLPEHSLVGTYVGFVPATDQDAGDSITYTIASGDPNGIFSINDQTGDLYVANAALLDYETQASYDLTIEATDLQGASSQTNVTVNLEDLNQLTYQNTFTFSAQNQNLFGPTAELAETMANNFANDLNQIAPSESFAWLAENGVSNSVNLNTNFTLDTGEYDASLPIELQVVLPDTIVPGQSFLLKSAAKLQDWATLDAESPSLNVDLGLDINVTPQLNLGNFFGQNVTIPGLGTLNLNAFVNSPIDVSATATLDAPTLTNSTSQVSDFASAISAQIQEANWAQPEITGTIEMFNLWNYLITNLGTPNGLSVGGANITLSMSPGSSPYGIVTAHSPTNPTEKIWEMRYAEPGSALAEGGGYPHGWQFSYYDFDQNHPIDTLVWTGDHLSGRISLNYNTGALPPITATSLHASGTWDSAVTHIDYVNLEPTIEQQLGLTQNLNLGLDKVAGQIIFTELAEDDANRVQDFTSGTTAGDLASTDLVANLINVPDNADANGDGIVEVDTQINPAASLTNYSELAYDLNARLVSGQVNIHTDITIASSSYYEIYPSLSPTVYKALRAADSDSNIPVTLAYGEYGSNTYYHYIDIHQSLGPVFDESASFGVIQPVVTTTTPDLGVARAAFDTGANTGNGLSLVVHEDTPSITNAFVPPGSSLEGYDFTITGDPNKGSVTIDPVNGTFTYNLENAFQGLATGDYEDVTFTYEATNGTMTENGFVTVIVEGDDGVANKYHDGSDVDFYLWDNTTIDTSADTYVITHGWRSSSSGDWVADMAKAIQSRPEGANANIILTDWSGLAGNLNYANAAVDTDTVGQALGNFLATEGIDATATNVHLIGHSLGAHVSGIAGDTYEANATTTGAIDEITGLDPAGPLFEDSISPLNDSSKRLDASDANRVSIFHTTTTLGYDGDLGDVDFYINPNDLLQPGQSDPIGNHSYAYQLYTQLLDGNAFIQADSSQFGYGSIETLNGSHNIDTTMLV